MSSSDRPPQASNDTEANLSEALTDERRFRMLVDAVIDYAIYMLDPSGQVVSWNSGAERFKGYTAAEIIGRHFSLFYTPEDRVAGLPARALRTAEQEGKFEGEGWRVRKDGSRYWTHVVIDPIRSPTGGLLGFAKVTRDLSERRAAQEQLERTRETLFRSQKMEAIGRLTGGVAHDFNNLLTAVIGSLELLHKRVGTDARARSLIDNALQAAHRGATLTQRMLAFARGHELQLEPIDLPTLVRGMTDLLQRTLGTVVTVETHFPLSLGRVLADPNQLEMSLLNLAVNARDAMPTGGLLTIAARQETVAGDEAAGLKPGRYILLSVIDCGEGMDEGTLQRATEPFFTTKGVGKGTGLGLSMVQGMAEQLGGQLTLSSEPGAGTTATLWLPILDDNRPLPPRERAVPPTAPEALLPMSILAVDDDPQVLVNTAAMLEDLGHRVVTASSARQALEKLDDGAEFDLVITDHAMPTMTGAQLIEAIRRRWHDLPVLLATAFVDLPPGIATDVPKIAKPYFQHQLAHAVAAVMRSQAPVSGSATAGET
jgi:PAS domain S-box-containing protein